VEGRRGGPGWGASCSGPPDRGGTGHSSRRWHGSPTVARPSALALSDGWESRDQLRARREMYAHIKQHGGVRGLGSFSRDAKSHESRSPWVRAGHRGCAARPTAEGCNPYRVKTGRRLLPAALYPEGVPSSSRGSRTRAPTATAAHPWRTDIRYTVLICATHDRGKYKRDCVIHRRVEYKLFFHPHTKNDSNCHTSSSAGRGLPKRANRSTRFFNGVQSLLIDTVGPR